MLSTLTVPAYTEPVILNVLRVPKATLNLDVLDGITGLRKAVTLTVVVCYTEKIQIEISNGKGYMG